MNLKWTLIRLFNRLGNRKKCYICERTFFYFTKYGKGTKGKSDFLKKLDGVGSDIDNFGCMYCGCHDRERHLFMYFDKLDLWHRMRHGKILHFAPERHLQRKISQQNPDYYVKADLCPSGSDVQKIDATAIPFQENMFDFIFANHVLEHIPDYRRALKELYRILKPEGIAILQTPYSRLLKKNFEDQGIASDALRRFFYGQEDHVRIFGEDDFLKSIEKAGFTLFIKKHVEYFNAAESNYFGVNNKEDLIMAVKVIKI
jgi:SAM-dependent methyltransferase